jgi:hypothetical protein
LSTNPVDYLQIIITKKNKSVVRINYNYELKYLLIPKIQVHAENSEKYKRSLSANRKYLDGTYKLYPSSEIEKLIASIKENG